MLGWLRTQPIDAFVDGGAASRRFWFCGINPRERGQMRESWGEREKTMKGVGREESAAQVSTGQRRGNEKRGQERRGEHQTDNQGRDTDVWDAIWPHCWYDSPRPHWRSYRPAISHSLLSSCGTAQRRSLLSLRALFEITSGFVSRGFILLSAFIPPAKFEGIFLPPAAHLETPLANMTVGNYFRTWPSSTSSAEIVHLNFEINWILRS